MTERNVKEVTGEELKKLLQKAVGGIYFGQFTNEFFRRYQVTEGALVLNYDNYTAITIPISDEEKYINYAIAGVDCDADGNGDEWEGSTYFEYRMIISGMHISFNAVEKSKELSLEQFREFVFHNEPLSVPTTYSVESVDSGSITIDMSDCIFSFNSGAIYFSELGSRSQLTIDEDIICSITNETLEDDVVSFEISFNNGMAALKIEPERNYRELCMKRAMF